MCPMLAVLSIYLYNKKSYLFFSILPYSISSLGVVSESWEKLRGLLKLPDLNWECRVNEEEIEGEREGDRHTYEKKNVVMT